MAFVVKNTTENGPIDIVCPYYCMGCGRLGSLLCECCKKYMLEAGVGEMVRKMDGVFWCGWREGLLKELVGRYKYGPVRGVGKVLAGLLDEVIPCLEEVTVVPLPTITRHIRERGFDHTKLVAKKLAKKRRWECVKLLERANKTVQVGANAELRKKQAKTAYRAVKKVDGERSYLLLDDVWTTGASMMAAEKELRRAGARKIYKAVVAVSK